MRKIIIVLVISLFLYPIPVQAATTDDPFTTHIQEKLINLGLLDTPPTGSNDKATQQAIKKFQEKAGLVVDGMVGSSTYSKLTLGENAYLPTSPTTTVLTTIIPTGPDISSPVWDKEEPPFGSEIGSLFNLNLPAVTDNVGIVSYEVYVNNVLSTYVTISDSRLLVTPVYDMTCADQLIYVIAFDAAGNSSQSPSFIIPQSDPCIGPSPSNPSPSPSNPSPSYFALTLGDTSNDIGYGIDIDSSGNSYITGLFTGTINFGGGNLTSAGGSDIFVLKLNSSGVYQWASTFGGTSNDIGYGIAVDTSGNPHITGTFVGTINFGGGNKISAGSSDMFVLKLNSSGVYQWASTFGGTLSDIGHGIAVDSSGNSYITGLFYGTVNFGGGNVTSAGGGDIFVLKLNSSGVYQWASTFGGTSSDVGRAIILDSSGDPFITGDFVGTINFGGGNKISAGSSDMFVLKLNSSGVYQWASTFGGTNIETGQGITVEGDNPYITGYFKGTVNFGGGNVTSAGGNDIFVLKLDSSGVFQRVVTIGGSSDDVGYSVTADSSGNTYFTGYFSGTVNFGGGNIISKGNDELFVLKLDPSGGFVWVNGGSGGTSNDIGYGIAVDSSGNSYTTGFFEGTVNFGGGNVTSAGGRDIFVLKLNSSGAFE